MTIRELIEALDDLEVTASCCEGCGHEHRCRKDGCAIIRAASDLLSAYEDTGLTPEQCAGLAKAAKEGRLLEVMIWRG